MPVSSSSASDHTKSRSSPPLHSATTTNSDSQKQSNLPPRLQKKQRQAEEENYLKYYKPMDYMRQTNSYHRKIAADGGAERGGDSVRQNGTGSARHVRDINSRGSVGSRTLWSDSMTHAANGRSSGADNMSSDGSVRSNTQGSHRQSCAGDVNQRDSMAGDQKPPAVVLPGNGGNKLVSLEAGVSSLNIQSTTPNHVPLHPSHVSLSYSLSVC